jgi:hypothetical protein
MPPHIHICIHIYISPVLPRYNQLLRIEEELGAAGKYTGADFRLPPLGK